MNTLNKSDYAFKNNAYKVTIGHFYSFEGIVLADSKGEAIDLVIDSWVKTEEENKGYFLSSEEQTQLGSDGYLDDYIFGGNDSRYTSFKNEELKVELVDSEHLTLTINRLTL